MQHSAEQSASGMLNRPHRWCGVIILALLLGACSTTTFFYNRLHIFIPWWVDDYVNLNAAQDDQLEALLVDYLRTHRSEYLPRYNDFIDQLLSSLDQPLTLERASELYDIAAAEVRQLEQDSLDWLLAVGETLSEQQVAEFLQTLEEEQQAYTEKYLPRNEQEFRDQVYDRLEDSLGDFLGRLQPEQRQRLREAARQTRRTDAVWLSQRAERLVELRALLARQPGWQQQVRAMVARQYEAPAQRVEVYQHNLEVFLQAVVDVVNQRTERQDHRLRGKLENLREDFQRLIEQGQEGS